MFRLALCIAPLLCGIPVPEDGISGLSQVSHLRNLAIAKVEVQTTRLERRVQIEVVESHYDSGIDAPSFEHGLYSSQCTLLDSLYGIEELPQSIEVGPYPTFEAGWQPHGWAVSPPFQRGEQLSIILEIHPLHGVLWRYDWRYLMPDHPTAARPRTPTFEDDLEILTAIGHVLDAEASEQWRLLRGYAEGSDEKLMTWAIDILLEELNQSNPESANHREAANILKEVAASPLSLGERPRGMIIQRLRAIPSAREVWMEFVEALARGDYQQRKDAWKMLAQLESIMLEALQRDEPDEIREQLRQHYAMALANRSISAQQREVRIRNLANERRRIPNLTDDIVFEILITVVRESDEPIIEAACIETIRDSIPLTDVRMQRLNKKRELVTTTPATTILDSLLNP